MSLPATFSRASVFIFLLLFSFQLYAGTSCSADIRATVMPKRESVDVSSFRRLTTSNIAEDTTVSGKILIEGFVTVAPQATLTILSGSELRFAPDSGLHVLGRIVATGTADSPVRFLSTFSAAAAADWTGLRLTGSVKRNVFEHVVVSGADTAINAGFAELTARNLAVETVDTGIMLLNSTAVIRDSFITQANRGVVANKSELDLDRVIFEDCGKGLESSSAAVSAVDATFAANRAFGMVLDNSRLKVERGQFIGNQVALKSTGSEGSITNSSFRNSGDTAVVLAASAVRFSGNLVTGGKVGVRLEDNFAVFWGNAFFQNSQYNLLYQGGERLFVGGNWFGSASEADAMKSIFSRQPGAVSVKPLLTAEPVINRELTPLRKRR